MHPSLSLIRVRLRGTLANHSKSPIEVWYISDKRTWYCDSGLPHASCIKSSIKNYILGGNELLFALPGFQEIQAVGPPGKYPRRSLPGDDSLCYDPIRWIEEYVM